MPSFTYTLLLAFALMLVVEGIIYAVFADSLRRLMAIASALPPQNLRIFGLLIALTGITFLYFLKSLAAR
jgi:uncharacterized protein YjeT (DUF2065 family)